jgi:hypothetical protein
MSHQPLPIGSLRFPGFAFRAEYKQKLSSVTYARKGRMVNVPGE